MSEKNTETGTYSEVLKGPWPMVTAIGVAGLVLRIRAVPRALPDVDAVNFARALAHFDPLHQAPHLPGYPIYVGATKLFAAFGTIPALVLPALLLFLPAMGLMFAGLSKRLGTSAAFGAIIFAAFVPGLITTTAAPMSDGLGFAMLMALVGLVAGWPRRAGTIGLLAGLLVGVRLTWWPLLIALPFLLTERRRLAAGTLAGAGLSAAALLFFAPPVALAEGLIGFARGHLTGWGQTALFTDTSAFTWAHSASSLFGGPWVLLLLVVSATLAATRNPRWALLIAGPYLAWLVVAQNPHHGRHLIPLVLLLGALTGRFLTSPAARGMAAAGLLLLALGRLPAAEALPPAAAIAQKLAARGPDRLQVFADESAPVIGYYAPSVRVWRPADRHVLLREAARAHRGGAEVLVVSDVEGAEAMDLVTRFGSLSLHRFTPAVATAQIGAIDAR